MDFYKSRIVNLDNNIMATYMEKMIISMFVFEYDVNKKFVRL